MKVKFMHLQTGSINNREGWLESYSKDDLQERGLAAEEAFREDLGRTFKEVQFCENLQELTKQESGVVIYESGYGNRAAIFCNWAGIDGLPHAVPWASGVIGLGELIPSVQGIHCEDPSELLADAWIIYSHGEKVPHDSLRYDFDIERTHVIVLVPRVAGDTEGGKAAKIVSATARSMPDPWEKKYPNMTSWDAAAKAIQADLKAAFPEIKFTVATKIFAGGNSVDIKWTDGPTEKKVWRLVRKYQAIFDIKGFKSDRIIPQAKYVLTKREFSEEVRACACEYLAQFYQIDMHNEAEVLDKTGHCPDELIWRYLEDGVTL